MRCASPPPRGAGRTRPRQVLLVRAHGRAPLEAPAFAAYFAVEIALGAVVMVPVLDDLDVRREAQVAELGGAAPELPLARRVQAVDGWAPRDRAHRAPLRDLQVRAVDDLLEVGELGFMARLVRVCVTATHGTELMSANWIQTAHRYVRKVAVVASLALVTLHKFHPRLLAHAVLGLDLLPLGQSALLKARPHVLVQCADLIFRQNVHLPCWTVLSTLTHFAKASLFLFDACRAHYRIQGYTLAEFLKT